MNGIIFTIFSVHGEFKAEITSSYRAFLIINSAETMKSSTVAVEASVKISQHVMIVILYSQRITSAEALLLCERY